MVAGLSKGTILFMHVERPKQLFCRFTAHREAVEFVRYLPEAKTFVSCCKEMELVFWKISPEERNVRIVSKFKLNKTIAFFQVMERDGRAFKALQSGSLEDHRDYQKDYTMHKDVDRFVLAFSSGEQELL